MSTTLLKTDIATLSCKLFASVIHYVKTQRLLPIIQPSKLTSHYQHAPWHRPQF